MKSKYMKRIMFLAAAALTMSSCDSFLDTSPEDLRSPEQIYETYSSTQNAMFGVYSYIVALILLICRIHIVLVMWMWLIQIRILLIWECGVLRLHSMIDGILSTKPFVKQLISCRM